VCRRPGPSVIAVSSQSACTPLKGHSRTLAQTSMLTFQ
jgi:hypothetical protein